ncbi:MAG: ribosome maturation factor RimM [Rhodocyclaceae bacterium]|jgi:16S rRNA processing protein RimM|nr:ribosome maturation factor RimM [Rhodocyclaceae bacterium]
MIVLGRISAPFGVQGWVKVQVFGDDPLAWSEMPNWWLSAGEDAEESAWQARSLNGCKAHGKGLIARFEGLADRNAAETLTGLYVGAPRAALPKTGADEFYWADLVGLEVVNEKGERLGRVAELLRSGAHEVLALRDAQDRRRLLPFVAAVVREVDLVGGRIRVEWGSDW